MLEEDGDREIFGVDHVRSVYGVRVDEVDMSNEIGKQVKINAGQSHGVRKGTQFAIYPYGFTDFDQIEKRIAIVEIVKSGAADSWAKIITNFGRGTTVSLVYSPRHSSDGCKGFTLVITWIQISCAFSSGCKKVLTLQFSA